MIKDLRSTYQYVYRSDKIEDTKKDLALVDANQQILQI
jgi:hypothetical protein